MKKMDNQELADSIKEDVVSLFHKALRLHRRACEMQCSKGVRASGRLLRQVSEMKDDGLDLNGCMEDPAAPGGITVQSGGT